MLLDILRQRFNVVMNERIALSRAVAPSTTTCSGCGPPYRPWRAFCSPKGGIHSGPCRCLEQRKLPETCIAVPQHAAKKMHAEGVQYSSRRYSGSVVHADNLIDKLRRQHLIRIRAANPTQTPAEACPWPTAASSANFRDNETAPPARQTIPGNFRRSILALRIDDVNFADIVQSLQAAWKIFLFIARSNDYANRQLSCLRITIRPGCVFNSWHSIGNYRCCSHQRWSTYNDHGLDHETAPRKKSCHTF